MGRTKDRATKNCERGALKTRQSRYTWIPNFPKQL